MKAGDWLVFLPSSSVLSHHLPSLLVSLPTIRSAYLSLSSNAQFAAEHTISTRIFNPHHHTCARQSVSDPYPSAEEVFLCSNTSEPDPQENFGDLFLADLGLANKRVGRRRLV